MDSEINIAIANIHQTKINAAVIKAQVLLQYDFSLSNITLLTSINDKKIKEIKNSMIESNCLDEEELIKKKNDIFKERNLITRKGLNHYFINELLIHYAHFHAGDPNQLFDIESLLIAWNLMIIHNPEVRHSDINEAMKLCRLMNAECLLSDPQDEDPETAGIWMSKTRDSESFYSYSNCSNYDLCDSGYEQLKPMNDVLTTIRAMQNRHAA